MAPSHHQPNDQNHGPRRSGRSVKLSEAIEEIVVSSLHDILNSDHHCNPSRIAVPRWVATLLLESEEWRRLREKMPSSIQVQEPGFNREVPEEGLGTVVGNPKQSNLSKLVLQRVDHLVGSTMSSEQRRTQPITDFRKGLPLDLLSLFLDKIHQDYVSRPQGLSHCLIDIAYAQGHLKCLKFIKEGTDSQFILLMTQATLVSLLNNQWLRNFSHRNQPFAGLLGPNREMVGVECLFDTGQGRKLEEVAEFLKDSGRTLNLYDIQLVPWHELVSLLGLFQSLEQNSALTGRPGCEPVLLAIPIRCGSELYATLELLIDLTPPHKPEIPEDLIAQLRLVSLEVGQLLERLHRGARHDEAFQAALPSATLAKPAEILDDRVGWHVTLPGGRSIVCGRRTILKLHDESVAVVFCSNSSTVGSISNCIEKLATETLPQIPPRSREKVRWIEYRNGVRTKDGVQQSLCFDYVEFAPSESSSTKTRWLPARDEVAHIVAKSLSIDLGEIDRIQS